MSYPCLDCSERFQEFDSADEHNAETGHEIGAWRADRDGE